MKKKQKGKVDYLEIDGEWQPLHRKPLDLGTPFYTMGRWFIQLKKENTIITSPTLQELYNQIESNNLNKIINLNPKENIFNYLSLNGAILINIEKKGFHYIKAIEFDSQGNASSVHDLLKDEGYILEMGSIANPEQDNRNNPSSTDDVLMVTIKTPSTPNRVLRCTNISQLKYDLEELEIHKDKANPLIPNPENLAHQYYTLPDGNAAYLELKDKTANTNSPGIIYFDFYGAFRSTILAKGGPFKNSKAGLVLTPEPSDTSNVDILAILPGDYGVNPVVDPTDKTQLIKSAIEVIEVVATKYPNKKIVLSGDSNGGLTLLLTLEK